MRVKCIAWPKLLRITGSAGVGFDSRNFPIAHQSSFPNLHIFWPSNFNFPSTCAAPNLRSRNMLLSATTGSMAVDWMKPGLRPQRAMSTWSTTGVVALAALSFDNMWFAWTSCQNSRQKDGRVPPLIRHDRPLQVSDSETIALSLIPTVDLWYGGIAGAVVVAYLAMLATFAAIWFGTSLDTQTQLQFSGDPLSRESLKSRRVSCLVGNSPPEIEPVRESRTNSSYKDILTIESMNQHKLAETSEMSGTLSAGTTLKATKRCSLSCFQYNAIYLTDPMGIMW
ncbi:hypothetical protein C8R45DRAFT_918225 [Mycena sanguinolenta]|nr:hypothetical protein C8R45DRAFT_918225 [Mycena sanguinolenta]